MKLAVLLLPYLFNLFLASEEPIPGIKICKPNDPNLAECWRQSISIIARILEEGLPSKNIPPVKDFLVPSYKTKASSICVEVSNIHFEGLTTFDIFDAEAKPDPNTADLQVVLSHLNVKCEVVSRGRIGDLPVTGSGSVFAVVKNLIVNWHGELETFEVEGVQYHRLEGYVGEVDYDSIEIVEQNVITDPESVTALKKIIEDKKSAFHDHFRPFVAKTYATRLSEYGIQTFNVLYEG